MKVSVIGLGYIGLPTATVLASHKVEVVGVDVSKHVVDTVNQGKIHIVEPELDVLVHNAVKNGYLRATIYPEESDIFMVAVPTPFKDNHEPDMSYIESAVKAIAPVLNKGNVVILESTSPVGSTEKITRWMQELRPELTFPVFGEDEVEFDIYVAHCPERVLPGRIIHELIKNDRIIGGMTIRCSEHAKIVYEIFVEAKCIVTDCRTAELSKLVENSFRDVNIAYANEISLICDKLNINVWKLIELANRHPRVDIMRPGPGVGGHCIAVDPWFVVHSAPSESNLIRTSRMVNDNKPKFIFKKIIDAIKLFEKPLSEINICCLGISYKPDIDDLRESPSIEIIDELVAIKPKNIYIVEPNISLLPNSFDADLVKLKPVEEALRLSDIVIILVLHKEFLLIDRGLLRGKKVIDTIGLMSNECS